MHGWEGVPLLIHARGSHEQGSVKVWGNQAGALWIHWKTSAAQIGGRTLQTQKVGRHVGWLPPIFEAQRIKPDRGVRLDQMRSHVWTFLSPFIVPQHLVMFLKELRVTFKRRKSHGACSAMR